MLRPGANMDARNSNDPSTVEEKGAKDMENKPSPMKEQLDALVKYQELNEERFKALETKSKRNFEEERLKLEQERLTLEDQTQAVLDQMEEIRNFKTTPMGPNPAQGSKQQSPLQSPRPPPIRVEEKEQEERESEKPTKPIPSQETIPIIPSNRTAIKDEPQTQFNGTEEEWLEYDGQESPKKDANDNIQ
eukprot:935528_1